MPINTQSIAKDPEEKALRVMGTSRKKKAVNISPMPRGKTVLVKGNMACWKNPMARA